MQFDKLLRKFKRTSEKKGVVKEVREREYFKKPSTLKNEKNQSLKRKKRIQELKRESSRKY